MITYTATEVAEELRISPRKVREVAKDIGVGANVGGTAGYRYSEADKLAIWESMRPVQVVERRRKRRSA